jgi:hypothetical protein
VRGLGGSVRGEQNNAREKKERGDKGFHIAASDTRIELWRHYIPGTPSSEAFSEELSIRSMEQ